MQDSNAPKKPSFHFLLIHLKGNESAGRIRTR